MILNRKPRAGRSAQQRYDEMAAAWRRRRLRRGRWVVWPIVVGSTFLATVPAPYSYFVGLTAGVVLMAWVAVNEMVPRHIGKWWDGAEGERKTEKALRPLEKEGWVVAHDLQSDRGNIDHLVLGPAGVYLLDSKLWQGAVTVTGDIATVTPIEDPDAAWSWPKLPGAMRAASAANHDALKRLTDVNVWITAVVVVWSPFEQGVVTSNKVTYVRGDLLAEWLRAQRVTLRPEHVRRLAQVIGS